MRETPAVPDVIVLHRGGEAGAIDCQQRQLLPFGKEHGGCSRQGLAREQWIKPWA